MTTKQVAAKREDSLRRLVEGAQKGVGHMAEHPLVNLALDLLDRTAALRNSAAYPEDFQVWYGQYTKSVGSVSANFIEGYARGSQQEFIKFLAIARGSAYEAYVWSRASGIICIVDDTRALCDLVDRIILEAFDNGP